MTSSVTSVHNSQRSCASYHNIQSEKYWSPDPFLFQRDAKADDHDASSAAVMAIVERTRASVFPKGHSAKFETMVMESAKVFQTPFSDKPAKAEPLHVELVSDARPVRVKLRNYSHDQRDVLKKLAGIRAPTERTGLPKSFS